MKTLTTKNTFGHLAITFLSLLSMTGKAQVTPALVDFDAYESLVAEVKEHRKTRMLTAEEFLATSKEEKVIILDTRSDSMYNAVHVKGAIHLNFSDFTQANLARIIPSDDYKVLIYCNNNFNTKPLTASLVNSIDFSRFYATKAYVPPTKFLIKPEPKKKTTADKKAKDKRGPNVEEVVIETELPTIAKPITLALNIPTYINLYGYGYRNIYELSELVNTYDHTFEFEGTAIK